MSEKEYIEEVIRIAVQANAPQTHFQQIIAAHMVGELDGSTPGVVERVIRQEIGGRITTRRHDAHPPPAR